MNNKTQAYCKDIGQITEKQGLERSRSAKFTKQCVRNLKGFKSKEIVLSKR